MVLTTTMTLKMTSKMGSFFLLGSLLLAGQQAHGQISRLSADRMTPAMKYFGHGLRTAPVARSQAARPQVRRQAPTTHSVQQAGGKPFQNIHRPIAISPYLGLDSLEGDVGLPNYYSLVRPQIQLQEAAAKQRRLQQRDRMTNASSVIANPSNGGVPTTGYRSKFLNNGSYYQTLRR